VQYGYALTLDAEYRSRLRSFRNAENVISIERGDTYLVPQSCLGKRHRHQAVQIFALTFKELVVLDVKDNVKIAGWAAIRAGFTLPGKQNARPLFHSRRYLDRDGFFTNHAAFTLATFAGMRNY